MRQFSMHIFSYKKVYEPHQLGRMRAETRVIGLNIKLFIVDNIKNSSLTFLGSKYVLLKRCL